MNYKLLKNADDTIVSIQTSDQDLNLSGDKYDHVEEIDEELLLEIQEFLKQGHPDSAIRVVDGVVTLVDSKVTEHQDMLLESFLYSSTLETAIEKYKTDRYAPIVFNDHTFQADKDSQDLIRGAISVYSGGTPEGFEWLDINNVWVPVSIDDLKALALAIGERTYVAFRDYRATKDSVMAEILASERL